MSATVTLRAWTGSAGLGEALETWPRDTRADPLCNAPDWIAAHARAFVEPPTIFGWSAESEGCTVGVFPFRVEPSRGAFALRRALHVADGTFDSDYLDLATTPGFEAACARPLLDALANERRIDAVVLAGTPNDSPMLAALRAELQRRRLPRREREGDCVAAPLPDSFDAYVTGLGKRMRSKVRQAMRQATDIGACLAWCDDAAELDAHLEGLFALHTERWESAGEPGSFAGTERRAFYRDIAHTSLDEGSLRFARLEHEGQPVAYQIGVVRGSTYYQLQEGFRPDSDGFRPATALRALAIERLIEQGVRSYDFMAGATRHKRDWGGTDRPCTTLAFALPRLRARLAYGARAWLDARRN